MSINENDQLQFDDPSTVQDQHLTTQEPEQTQKLDVSNYDNLDPATRRKRMLYDIKTGKIDINIYPNYLRTHIKNYADLIVPSKIDGQLVVDPTLDPNSQKGRLAPKVNNLLSTGRIGDLADHQNSPMWIDLAKAVSAEVERKIVNKSPKQVLDQLEKSGDLDEIIKANMRKENFDLFALPAWFKVALRFFILQQRKETRKDASGKYEESSLLEETQQILHFMLFD